jgi:hypothetical protein
MECIDRMYLKSCRTVKFVGFHGEDNESHPLLGYNVIYASPCHMLLSIFYASNFRRIKNVNAGFTDGNY